MALSGGTNSQDGRWNVKPEGFLRDSTIRESSGVAVSRQFADVLWTHNDAHNLPELFGVTRAGRLIRSYQLEKAQNNDWEDIAIDSRNHIWILDNTSQVDSSRRSVIYRFQEPDPRTDSKIQALQRFYVEFPDSGHDCETMFVWKDVAYFVTKPWDGSQPRVYAFHYTGLDGVAEYVGELNVQSMITGGDISEDGKRIALSSYRALFVFEGEGTPPDILGIPPRISNLNAGQIEGIAWSGEDLILTNEQRDVFLIRNSAWRNGMAPFVKTPTAGVPYVSSPPRLKQALNSWTDGAWLVLSDETSTYRISRVVRSDEGLHIGIELPRGFELGPVDYPKSREDWFEPGSLYLLLNPHGDRPIVFQADDRCVLIGRGPDGMPVADARYLKPATLIGFSELMPPWIHLDEHDRRLLVSLSLNKLGLGKIAGGCEIGFNLIVVGPNGELLSWAPLTIKFRLDSPSVWGVLELKS
jgi:hypothetical protein